MPEIIQRSASAFFFAGRFFGDSVQCASIKYVDVIRNTCEIVPSVLTLLSLEEDSCYLTKDLFHRSSMYPLHEGYSD